MELYSRYLNAHQEVPEYRVSSGGDVVTLIPHDLLEELVYNSIAAADNNIQVHYTPVVIEPNHYAFLCAINDKHGRRIECIGESLAATLETDIARNYPALMAVKRAFDDAAIKFFGFPGKVYSDQQIMSAAAPVAAEGEPSAPTTTGEAEMGSQNPTGNSSTDSPKSDSDDEHIDGLGAEAVKSPEASPTANHGDLSLDEEPLPDGSASPTNAPDVAPGTSTDATAKVAPAANNAPKGEGTNAMSATAPGEPDEFDTIIVDVGSVKRMKLSIRECHKQHPNTVEWVANTAPVQSDERKVLKDACIRFLQRVADGLEG